ncbi:MAG TPA: DNA polymerase I, partial [Clostridiales bacterium]|nr:DNA polymerase I [Clostridiales bacterium]
MELVLIDGNSLINRAFYATPLLTSPDGTPTNAVYAFLNMLFKIEKDLSPKYLLVAFDRKEPTFRHKEYAGYKAGRRPMPTELAVQIPLLKEVLDAMGIAHYEKAGFEADDIIGSYAKQISLSTAIFTGDRDAFQLVDGHTSVYFTKRGITETDVYDVNNFKEKYGVEPQQVIDLKACMGDQSDNIKGIEGVGEKTALSLISTYSSIENLYKHTDELKGKLKEKVENGKESAFLSKKLATICDSMPLELPLESLEIKPLGEQAKRLFIKLG